MSQNIINTASDPSGDNLMDVVIAGFLQNFLTNNAGTGVPSYVQGGTLWIDTTTNPWVLKFFDGTNSVSWLSINTSTHLATALMLIAASNVTFNNAGSGLAATNVNAALLELATASPPTSRATPQSSKSADYTLVLADANSIIYHPATDANNRTFTIPANASVAFPVGTLITFDNDSANALSIAITTDTLVLAGVGSTGTRTLAQYGIATAEKVTSTRWKISGVGLS